jgi:hypothetical protein
MGVMMSWRVMGNRLDPDGPLFLSDAVALGDQKASPLISGSGLRYNFCFNDHGIFTPGWGILSTQMSHSINLRAPHSWVLNRFSRDPGTTAALSAICVSSDWFVKLGPDGFLKLRSNRFAKFCSDGFLKPGSHGFFRASQHNRDELVGG